MSDESKARRIVALCGSTRTDSCNRKWLARAIEALRQRLPDATVETLDLQDFVMPWYDGDIEQQLHGLPAAAQRLRTAVLASDALLLATPEYNASVPGALKNAIDWLSRAADGSGGTKEVFEGRPIVLLAASPSAYGGQRAVAHLTAILENLGAAIVPVAATLPLAMAVFAGGTFHPEVAGPAIERLHKALDSLKDTLSPSAS